MALSAEDKKSLLEIHRLFLELEKSTDTNSVDFSLHEEALESLKEKIQNLRHSSNPNVTRLADLEKHLVVNQTLKHFVSFAIPFERLLKKDVQDDEFLIIEKDKTEAPAEALPLVFVLDNIRSAFNVGSLFRTAECLGATKIHLCGYTPTPAQWKVEKTAMGTQQYLPWEEHTRLNDCLTKLKSQGYRIVGLETAVSAVDLYQPFTMAPTAFVLGNERFGIDSESLQAFDEVRIIPLRGRKNSLNVGVTAAVAGFEWMRQWNLKK
jgi:23S rRNA (guanosine2251-2'-O)-methyltransferase